MSGTHRAGCNRCRNKNRTIFIVPHILAGQINLYIGKSNIIRWIRIQIIIWCHIINWFPACNPLVLDIVHQQLNLAVNIWNMYIPIFWPCRINIVIASSQSPLKVVQFYISRFIFIRINTHHLCHNPRRSWSFIRPMIIIITDIQKRNRATMLNHMINQVRGLLFKRVHNRSISLIIINRIDRTYVSASGNIGIVKFAFFKIVFYLGI